MDQRDDMTFWSSTARAARSAPWAAGTVALVAMLAAPSGAHAQDRSRTGFKIGEKSKLHLGLGVATSYDTNSLRREDIDQTPEDETAGVDDVRMLVRPSFDVDVPGRSAAFRIGAGATISRFLGVGSASSDETLFGFDGDLYLRLGSRRAPVMFTLQNTPILTPTVLPSLGSIGADERLFPAFTDTGRAYLTLRPGGGALEFDVGYENSFIIYNQDQAFQPPDDGFNHLAFVEARLKFLPKTALLFKADFGWFAPSNTNPDRNDPLTLRSNPYSITLGLIGQVTRTISAEIRAGYAETLTWDRDSDRFGELSPANQRDLIGLVALKWKILKTAEWSLGYQRVLQPTVALSSVRNDSIRTRITWGIGRLVLGGYGEFQLRSFGKQFDANNPNAPVPGIEEEPVATLVFGGARADYYFTDWLTGGLNYRLMYQASNDEDRGNVLPALGGFTRHQFFANVGLYY